MSLQYYLKHLSDGERSRQFGAQHRNWQYTREVTALRKTIKANYTYAEPAEWAGYKRKSVRSKCHFILQ